MSDNQIIGASVQVGTGSSNANIKEVNKNLKDVKATLADTGKAAAGVGKDLEGATGHFKNIKEQLAAVSPAGAAATEGVGKFSAALKVLAANPVVAILTAIVAVLALIYKAFTNTFEGGEKVEQIFSGIKAAGQALLDSLDKIGSAIVKVFKFDFSGAIADIKAVGDAVGNAYSKMAALTQEAQKLAREQATNDLEQAERAKKLAILREQATDEDIPVAKRKAALKELQKASEDNAREDIDLAKRTAENKIAQLTLEKDGEKKNFIEIQKIKADQVKVETDNANELRRINKQLTATEKQENAERVEAQKAAAEKTKEERLKLIEYNNTLRKLQNENELATIKDGYDKELKQLQIKIADEKRANEQAFKDKKLTADQYATINQAIDIQANVQRDAITEKHNKEIQTKEVAFQKELAAITTKTRLDGIIDSRELEKVQLEIGYQEKLAQAIEHYKDDSEKLQIIKNAIDAQHKAEQDKLDAKNAKEDEKNKVDKGMKALGKLIDDPAAPLKAKKEALDAEVKLNQDAFDQKLITEQEYNANVEQLAAVRKTIKQQEIDMAFKAADVAAGLFDAVAEAAGKQTAVGKALSIASTTIATIESAVKAFNSFADIPIIGTALGVAAAAAAISGFNNVKKIIAVQVPGHGGGSGGSVPSVAQPAAPIAPTQTSTSLDANTLNGIGNAAAHGVNSNVRAFVLDSDIEDHRQRSERLNRASRLGG